MLIRALKMLVLSGGLALAAVAAFVIIYVRPFEEPSALSNDALAYSWNESINRLGISPVYPPHEDMQVGDVAAVVVGAENTGLLRKSIRVAHIDMRDLILKEQQDQLHFADTVVANDGDPIRLSDRLAVAASLVDRVALTLTAFPGFAVRYSRRASASASTSRWSLAGARSDEEVEEIRIPVAETYGVSSVSAVERLQDWCRREELPRRCTEKFNREVLQFALGKDALAERNGVKPHVELMLVTRVYLMREIYQRRASASRRDVGATAARDVTDPAVAPTSSTPTDNSAFTAASTTANTAGAPTTAEADVRATTGTRSAISRRASTDIALRRSFQRPLVFGYRFVSITPQ